MIYSVAEAREQFKENTGLLESFDKLAQWVSDLEVFEEHGTLRLVAQSANARAEYVDLYHSYEACCKTPVVAYPYYKVLGYRIYTSPTAFVVGCHNPDGYGDLHHEGWWNALANAGIAPLIIESIGKYFQSHQPVGL